MKIYKIGLLSLMLISGCTPDIAEWTPAESPKDNTVDRAVFTYFVKYLAHDKEWTDIEKRKLHQFMKNTIISPSAVAVVLVEYGGHSEKRVKQIEREFIKYGVPADLITVDYDYIDESYTRQNMKGPCESAQKHYGNDAGATSGVEIVLERFLVIPPSCGNFSKQMGDGSQDYLSSNYGCATEANLGMMVANPRDLIRGREQGAYRGKVMAAGVNRYDNDKVKALLDVTTTTSIEAPAATSSGGGGGGSSTGTTGGQ
jgi:pilus assembly protein CpaD